MNFFNILTMFGGLALFLYGMRLMSSTLKESSSGTLKKIVEKVTDNLFKAFLLGVFVTAVIQSSTATIVITSGLVAAGIITLRQSLGIIIGANVGTTVTGQIIRLLDLDSSSVAWLQIFKPSTLAPVALIAGIILIMFCTFRKSDQIGSIAMGFGILFSGLLMMTDSVNVLSETGIFDSLFTNLDRSPIIGYLIGAGVAFVLQSSSATIGILQAFSLTGLLSFKSIYAVLVGIYLGDCVTTAIVCSIGAKPEARRVGIVNILFNLSETLLVLIVVTVIHKLGLIDTLWNTPLYSGGIANTNTVFNLGCSILLIPFAGYYEKLSRIIIKDEKEATGKYAEKIRALDRKFFPTPALAFKSSYDALLTMFDTSCLNIERSFALLKKYDEKTFALVNEDEDEIDRLADSLSNYLVELSKHINEDGHIRIMNQYYKVISEFERLGDHALNIAEGAEALREKDISFSEEASREIDILHDIIDRILEYARKAFEKRDIASAHHIEPLEEVVDDLVNAFRDNHLDRMRRGLCNPDDDNVYLNLLSDIERISDVCSNIGIAIVARVQPELAEQAHSYISSLHQGRDEDFNKEYSEAHLYYFSQFR